MLSHRLDFAHFLVGPMRRVTALTSQIWPTRVDEGGVEHVSDTEDWVGCLAEFASGVTGVFESVKTATGYAGGATSRDFCEVNGSDGAVIYELSHPLRVLRAGKGGNYVEEAVPAAFRKIAGSPAQQRSRRVAGLPVRPGLRVHRSHPWPAGVSSVVSRRPEGAGSDGGDPDVGRRASRRRPRRHMPVSDRGTAAPADPRRRPGRGRTACRGGTWARCRRRRDSGWRRWPRCSGRA